MQPLKNTHDKERYEYVVKLTVALQLANDYLCGAMKVACTPEVQDKDTSDWPKLMALQTKTNQIMVNLFVHNYLVCEEDKTQKEVNALFYEQLVKLMQNCGIKI